MKKSTPNMVRSQSRQLRKPEGKDGRVTVTAPQAEVLGCGAARSLLQVHVTRTQNEPGGFAGNK